MAHCPDVLEDKPHPSFLRKIVSRKSVSNPPVFTVGCVQFICQSETLQTTNTNLFDQFPQFITVLVFRPSVSEGVYI